MNSVIIAARLSIFMEESTPPLPVPVTALRASWTARARPYDHWTTGAPELTFFSLQFNTYAQTKTFP